MLITTPSWKKIKQLRLSAKEGLLNEAEFKFLIGMIPNDFKSDLLKEENKDTVMIEVPIENLEDIKDFLNNLNKDEELHVEGFSAPKK